MIYTVKKLIVLIWIVVLGAIYLVGPQLSIASRSPLPIQKRIKPLVGPHDSVAVSAPNGSMVVSINADKVLVPASILKVLTCLVALETLGPEFRFHTEFYLDSKNNLKIKGFGDPLLVSEQLEKISSHLATLLSKVNNIVLDDTYFAYPIQIPGRGTSMEPYDAPNGALCVNFNTVAFTRKNGKWVTGEDQTPLLPLVIPKIEASGLTSGRITLIAGRAEAIDYTGALFHYFLKKSGIKVLGSIEHGRVDPQLDQLLLRHPSESNLAQSILKLLEYSNNFIANQILLVMGAENNGPPATMEKGLAVLKRYCHNTLSAKYLKIVEASGISRENRITAQDMLEILNRFSPYYGLMRHKGRQFYKTGHLKGIRTRAGYIESRNGGFYRFVVMLNTPGKATNRIMQILEEELR